MGWVRCPRCGRSVPPAYWSLHEKVCGSPPKEKRRYFTVRLDDMFISIEFKPLELPRR